MGRNRISNKILPKYITIKKNRYVKSIYCPELKRVIKEIPICSAKEITPDEFTEFYNANKINELIEHRPGPIASKEDIIYSSVPVNNFKMGVYFLIDNNEIVYIGKTKNLYQRLIDHKNKTKKQFTRYYFISVSLKYIDQVEQEYIKLYRPKYNKLHCK